MISPAALFTTKPQLTPLLQDGTFYAEPEYGIWDFLHQ